MNNEVIILKKLFLEKRNISTTLSFSRFINHIEQRSKSETTIRKKLFSIILDKAEKHPEWHIPTAPDEITENNDLIYELIYTYLVPAADDEQQIFFGITVPLTPHILYSSDGFHAFVKDMDINNNLLLSKDLVQREKMHLKEAYILILRRLFDIQVTRSEEYIQAYQSKGGTVKYMNNAVNHDFVDIRFNGELPTLNKYYFQSGLLNDKALEYLQEKLPLNQFSFEGFSVIRPKDVTSSYVIEKMKNIILNKNREEIFNLFDDVIQLLQSLVGTREVEFGIIPFVEINHKLVVDHDSSKPMSFVVKKVAELGLSKQELHEYLLNFRDGAVRNCYQHDRFADQPIINDILNRTDVKRLSLVPIYYNQEITGILEVYSFSDVVFTPALLGSLDPAIVLLGQLLKQTIAELNNNIERVIKDEFTSLQAAVEWKFRELVWNNLKGDCFDIDYETLGTVSFQNVYPLYGAIDIRNSTWERSQALRADFQIQLTFISNILTTLQNTIDNTILSELLVQCNDHLKSLDGYLTTGGEIEIYNFLQHDIYETLEDLKSHDNNSAKIIQEYFDAVDDKTHVINQNRSKLEESMRLINAGLAKHLKDFQSSLQEKFPTYFESFRTDGIEYDAYVGQSIAPTQLFDKKLIEEFRWLQLNSMVSVVGLMKSLLPELPISLHTTQLIFVHENAIDISFRKDERRFDVEGAYNIRYQVLKKRIDKVRIKDSEERLTQPGKIAIVFLSNTIEREYNRHIERLQTEAGPMEIEHLTLEDLQGVSGLKAIRIKV